MKKILLLLVAATAFAQTPKTVSELSVGGAASLKVKPDVCIITVSVEKENESEKGALKDLNDEMEKLQKFFTKVGIPSKSIKISEYSIESDFNNNGKKVYNAKNSLEIEFKLNNALLDAFYQELQAGNFTGVDVSFDTELSQELEKSTRRALVQLAIDDAKANAENITKPLGFKIVNVKSVTSSNFDTSNPKSIVEEVKFKPLEVGNVAFKPTTFSKFEVTEKELSESISIIYEISK